MAAGIVFVALHVVSTISVKAVLTIRKRMWISLLLAGCASAPQGAAPMPLVPVAPHHATHRDWSPSRMAPHAATAKELLYLSDDDTYDVDVYDYPSGTQLGTLTGFNQPNDLCVDKRGDVWVTNYGGGSVSEYAHGGTKPLQTLPSGAFQAGCAVDPTTGDLAVTELYGLLEVFKHATGRPKMYTSPLCPAFWAPAYDPQGNLFAESSVNGTTVICELAHGAKKLENVGSDMTIFYPAGVVWDGKYLAFGDQSFDGQELLAGLYQATESPSGLTQIGSTELSDGACGQSNVLEAFILGTKNTPSNRIQGTAAISTNYSCLGNVDIWSYPAGGNASGRFANAPKFPNGQVVSFKT